MRTETDSREPKVMEQESGTGNENLIDTNTSFNPNNLLQTLMIEHDIKIDAFLSDFDRN